MCNRPRSQPVLDNPDSNVSASSCIEPTTETPHDDTRGPRPTASLLAASPASTPRCPTPPGHYQHSTRPCPSTGPPRPDDTSPETARTYLDDHGRCEKSHLPVFLCCVLHSVTHPRRDWTACDRRSTSPRSAANTSR